MKTFLVFFSLVLVSFSLNSAQDPVLEDMGMNIGSFSFFPTNGAHPTLRLTSTNIHTLDIHTYGERDRLIDPHD